ncbi:MAG: CinA family protein [Ruminococcaceae bacterium]|nr:CinA family protein [Oscillospiraceae bacterium]
MEKLVKFLCENNLKITSAESCTGGLFAAGITAVSGSSSCFDGSFVTYSNEQKHKLLGVKNETLENFGAVSFNTALEMAKGVRESFGADIGIGITGIAGPTGGTKDKPVGLVYIAVSFSGASVAYKCNFSGSRDEVRGKAVEFAENLAFDTAKKLLTQGEF